jgi:glycosyltransferase involved in cell wall biosynthesis
VKISVVIATFNAAETIAVCLQSIANQTWPDKEIIVIDGGSTDGTIRILQDFEEQIAYWESKPDDGIFDAWNKALDHVTGTWVLYLGADDQLWDERALERAHPSLASARPSALVYYGTCVVVDKYGFTRRILGEPWETARRRFFQEMAIPDMATFHHVELFRRFGRFDPSLRLSADYDLLLRVLKHPDVEAKFIPGVIVTKMFDGGVSGTRVFRSRYEAILARRRNHIPGLSWLLYWQLITNFRFWLLRRASRLILGVDAADRLYRWRRRARSDRLQEELVQGSSS